MKKSAAQKTQRRREEISFDFSISQVEFSTIPVIFYILMMKNFIMIC